MNEGIDPSRLWSMTADEICGLITAKEADNAQKLRRLYKAGEALAFNTAALCMTAFNAPHRFPKTVSEAFIKPAASGGSMDFAVIAEQINKNMDKKRKEQQGDC